MVAQRAHGGELSEPRASRVCVPSFGTCARLESLSTPPCVHSRCAQRLSVANTVCEGGFLELVFGFVKSCGSFVEFVDSDVRKTLEPRSVLSLALRALGGLPVSPP